MIIEIRVPTLPESVSDAKVITWHKKAGEAVTRDESLVDLETDKIVLEVPAPANGVLKSIIKDVESVVKTNELLAELEAEAITSPLLDDADTAISSKPKITPDTSFIQVQAQQATHSPPAPTHAGPSVRRVAAEHSIPLDQVEGSGKSGRVTREDILRKIADDNHSAQEHAIRADGRLEKRVPMTRLRMKIAERLLAAQHEAAILTTFNEVNLKKVMELRTEYKESFEKKHGTRLGLMSFFTKAVIEALKIYPVANASIDGNDIVYHGYFDIGIAVSSDRGLVVPIIRSADRMSFAELEQSISDFARKAREGQLTLAEITGGTFTISNGGVFGSLLATPIINPPQSAILGMNKIEDRPIVEKGQMVIRPMMYLSLSYDHRIIDGKESICFLRTIKDFLEDPARLLLGI